MNLEKDIKHAISTAFKEVFNHLAEPESIALQPTRKDFEGSHTFVTFPYLKVSKKGPEETGQLIGEFLKQNSNLIAEFNVVKGFLNFTLNDNIWLDRLRQMQTDINFGFCTLKWIQGNG